MDWPGLLKEIKEIIFRPLTLFGIAVTGVLLLVLPEKIMTWFGLIAFRQNYKGWISGTILVSIVFFLLHLLTAQIYPWIKSKIAANAYKKSFRESLSDLSKSEQERLAQTASFWYYSF